MGRQCGEQSYGVSTYDEADVTTSKPKFDPKIAERLENAVAICDAGFLLHDGFPSFVESYFVRPYTTFLLVPSGVDEDSLQLGCLDNGRRDRSILAKAYVELLTQWGYAEVNGLHADKHTSSHVQILRTADYLRTNHRVCILSNSSRLIQDIQHLRKDRRKQANGVSCIRLSDRTLKPMVARWYDPVTYATSYLGR